MVEKEYEEGVVIVIFEKGIEYDEAVNILEERNLRLYFHECYPICYVTVPEGEETRWCNKLSKLEQVRSAELNIIYTRHYGAMVPPHLAWTIGKNARTVKAVQEWERYIDWSCMLLDEFRRFKDRVKNGEVVLTKETGHQEILEKIITVLKTRETLILDGPQRIQVDHNRLITPVDPHAHDFDLVLIGKYRRTLCCKEEFLEVAKWSGFDEWIAIVWKADNYANYSLLDL